MSNEFNVLTIGDAMITMNPVTTGPLRYVTQFDRKVGGAEMNFAIGCARLGLGSKWISRLGDDDFGKVIYNFARGEGIDVSAVRFVEGIPTSLNFKEIHESGAGKTYYYRNPSPMMDLTAEDITEVLFADIQLVHLTGVYLAIAEKHREVVHTIIRYAKQLNIPISFDPNIRLKLWGMEEARAVYESIFPDVDILLTGLDEIQMISQKESLDELTSYIQQFNIADFVIKDGANGSRLWREGRWTEAAGFTITPIDTVGAGDGFDAGYVYGWLKGYNPEKLLHFANGVGALVTTVTGDNEGLPYLEDVSDFVEGRKVAER